VPSFGHSSKLLTFFVFFFSSPYSFFSFSSFFSSSLKSYNGKWYMERGGILGRDKTLWRHLSDVRRTFACLSSFCLSSGTPLSFLFCLLSFHALQLSLSLASTSSFSSSLHSTCRFVLQAFLCPVFSNSLFLLRQGALGVSFLRHLLDFQFSNIHTFPVASGLLPNFLPVLTVLYGWNGKPTCMKISCV
jgi:hypothetical protein